MAVLATYTMDNFSSSEPKGLSSSVETLNRALKSISCTKTGEQIYEMSIKYWKIHPQLEMTLSVNVIHWLLIQTLNSKAAVSYFSILILDYIIIVWGNEWLFQVKHMKILLGLKETIKSLDPITVETSGLLKLFLLCVSNSSFINVQEGRKLVSILFRFGPNVIQVNLQILAIKSEA